MAGKPGDARESRRSAIGNRERAAGSAPAPKPRSPGALARTLSAAAACRPQGSDCGPRAPAMVAAQRRCRSATTTAASPPGPLSLVPPKRRAGLAGRGGVRQRLRRDAPTQNPESGRPRPDSVCRSRLPCPWCSNGGPRAPARVTGQRRSRSSTESASCRDLRPVVRAPSPARCRKPHFVDCKTPALRKRDLRNDPRARAPVAHEQQTEPRARTQGPLRPPYPPAVRCHGG